VRTTGLEESKGQLLAEGRLRGHNAAVSPADGRLSRLLGVGLDGLVRAGVKTRVLGPVVPGWLAPCVAVHICNAIPHGQE
jgi:hypothetical protein